MKRIQRLFACVLAGCVSFAGFMASAQATLISTEAVAVSQGVPGIADVRGKLNAALDRADVTRELAARGVDAEQVRARVAALTDAEAALVAAQIDSAPAGATDVLGAAVFIFVLLLVTDILGLTKIFPFTRSVR
jgi:hypothetical protein